MTVRDVVAASGVSRGTIYNHLHFGKLRGYQDHDFHWHVKPEDLFQWADYCWSTNRIYMYPPDRIRRFARDFQLK